MASLQSVQSLLKARRAEHTRMATENAVLGRFIRDNEQKMLSAIEQLKTGQLALEFLEDIANSRRNSAKERIESVVSEALKLVYGSAYSVKFTYRVRNNRSHMEIKLVKKTQNGEVERDMDGFGGGVSDCISVPMRLMVLLSSNQVDNVCVLDECYKHVDLERIEAVAEFLHDIAGQLSLQIILLSHHEVMQTYADRVFQLKDENGRAVVRKIK